MSTVLDRRIDLDHCPTSDSRYSVYHGGKLYGMGRWAGPGLCLSEAWEAQRACQVTVGGSPFVALDDDEDARMAAAIRDGAA